MVWIMILGKFYILTEKIKRGYLFFVSFIFFILCLYKYRGLVLSLIEVHDKVTSLLEVGVRSKEIFALVVDNIMNMMPEIIVQLMIMLFAPIIMQLLGK